MQVTPNFVAVQPPLHVKNILHTSLSAFICYSFINLTIWHMLYSMLFYIMRMIIIVKCLSPTARTISYHQFLSRMVTALTVTAAYVNVWPANAGANAYVVILSPVLLRVGTALTVIATSAFGHKYYIIF